MRCATVMVSLALDQPNEARLQVAGELAERFEAAIVGVAAAQFVPPLYFTDGTEAQALIVAGAYDHSRFRELILGGVIQYLVTQSARNVLLSH